MDSSCSLVKQDEVSTTEEHCNSTQSKSMPMSKWQPLPQKENEDKTIRIHSNAKVKVKTVSKATTATKRMRRKPTKFRKSYPIGVPIRPFRKISNREKATYSSTSLSLSPYSNKTTNTTTNSDGTPLGPRLKHCVSTTFSSSAFTTISNLKRRSGLVRRTHSPNTVSSPVTKSVYRIIASKTNLPYIKMGSKAIPISDDLSPQLMPRPLGLDQKIFKKRKRCQSPRNTGTSIAAPSSRSRSRSPNNRRSRLDASPKDHHTESPGAIKVKMVSPTLRGVTESARILRSGIFSFPTERLYSLVSFIPFKRRTEASIDCHWDTLLHMKARKGNVNMNTSTNIDEYNSDPALLYVHRPGYAYNYMSFSKPKTFVYKEQLRIKDEEVKVETDTQKNPENKFTAVTLSESHEVMNRLTSAFWPGPVTIFAPVKRVRSRSSSSFITQLSEQQTDSTIQNRSSSSLSSLISLSSENGDDQPPTLSTNDDDCEGTSPILPLTALRPLKSLIPTEENKDSYYVGMRCPSHPLARRVLAEVYGEQNGKKSQTPKRRQRIPGAVVGFNASIPIPNTTSLPFSCKDVCSSLLSVQDDHGLTPSTSNVQNQKPVVHVMNGEDRREMFFVPTCQYGQSSSVSLVIDASNRRVFILRDKAYYLNSQKVKDDFDLQVEDVIRALHQEGQNEPGSVKSKAITAVMHKWKVYEK